MYGHCRYKTPDPIFVRIASFVPRNFSIVQRTFLSTFPTYSGNVLMKKGTHLLIKIKGDQYMKKENAPRATAGCLNGIHIRSRCVRQTADPREHKARTDDGGYSTKQPAFALNRADCFGGPEPVRGNVVFRNRMDMAAINMMIQGVAAATPIFLSRKITA